MLTAGMYEVQREDDLLLPQGLSHYSLQSSAVSDLAPQTGSPNPNPDTLDFQLSGA